MKTRLMMLCFVPVSFISLPSHCENITDSAAYITGMRMIDVASTENQYIEAGEYFLKLADSDNDLWLPYYYAGLSFNLASEKVKDPGLKDNMADRAEQALTQALKIDPDEPELKILQAFIYQARIMANPVARGLSYSSRAGSILDEVLSVNPGNPRAVMLKAYNIYYTPVLLKGGAKNALPVFEEAAKLFTVYKPDSDISPQWGAKETAGMINTCRKETAGK